MIVKIYNFEINLDWNLVKRLSKVDRFDASWSSYEKIQGPENLKYLKSLATIRSIGSSTRIEGSLMNDEEVELLLKDININKLKDRDSQEVAGYFEVLDTITEMNNDIHLGHSSLKGLHNSLMKYSEKDEWHKGQYKKHSNAVEAVFADGSRQIIFKTTDPGYSTDDAMEGIINWYNQQDDDIHAIIKVALFVYDFLSIHPFQDGNGRMSRLLTNLLLTQSGYTWIQYVSFEHEIENRTKDYYRILRTCQANRPGEDITEWVVFFLECLATIQNSLLAKIASFDEVNPHVTSKEKLVYNTIVKNPGSSSGQIAQILNFNLATTKKLIYLLFDKGLIAKSGVGRGTVYAVIK